MTTESPNVQWPEDFGHQSEDIGTFVLGVRNDNNIVFTDADLDYTPIAVDASGAIKVVIGGEPFEIRPLDCGTDSITVCPPATGVFQVEVTNPGVTGVIETRPLECETDSVTICPGEQPIVVVPGTCFPVNVRLDCEVDSVTVCPSPSGFGVDLNDYPPSPVLSDDGGPFSFAGAGAISNGLYRAFTLTVIQGPVTVNGITVPTGFSISRSADPGGTVPGFSFNGTGGQIIVDVVREV